MYTEAFLLKIHVSSFSLLRPFSAKFFSERPFSEKFFLPPDPTIFPGIASPENICRSNYSIYELKNFNNVETTYLYENLEFLSLNTWIFLDGAGCGWNFKKKIYSADCGNRMQK